MLRDELDNGKPVVYRGEDEDGGHCWVVDGYDRNQNRHFHFNWGWNGNSNMFYYLKDGNDYNKSMGAIINIKPDNFADCNSFFHIAETMQYIEDNFNLIPETSLYLTPYHAGNLINGGNNTNSDYRTIKNGQTAIYIAYNAIRLLPGFTAQPNSNLLVKIEICPALCSKTNFSLKNSAINSVNNNCVFEASHDITKNSRLQKDFVFNAFPNPFSDKISIIIKGNIKEKYIMKIINVSGTVVYLDELDRNECNSEISISTSNIPAGLYVLIIQSNSEIYSQKLIKL